METNQPFLHDIFEKLDRRIEELNRDLVREAITSGAFPGLVSRMQKHGAKLDSFI
jgi:hypothetical protein